MLFLDFILKINFSAVHYYNTVRQRYFNISFLEALFKMDSAQNILGLIRDIGLYNFT